MTILVDMDDVLDDLLAAWVGWLNRTHGTTVYPDDVDDWDIAKFFPYLTRSQVFEPLYLDEFWSTVWPRYGAYTAMAAFKKAGDKVYVVTNSHYKTLTAKMENVLFKYFPLFTWDDVIVTSKKQLLRGDVLIDDNPQNLVGGDYVGILMDMPHNRSFDEVEHNNILRAYNWDDVMSIIKTLRRRKNKNKGKEERDYVCPRSWI